MSDLCTAQLPKPKADVCDPQVNFGQFRKLYLAKPGNPFEDIEDLQEWADRLSNSSNDEDAVRFLHIIGDKPEAEDSEIQISLGRVISGPMNHTINFEIDETNDDNYAWMRAYQGGGREVLAWVESESGNIFGGNSGIRASLKVKYVVPRESTEVEKIIGTLKWRHIQDPERTPSPVAGEGS
jgi:hypothetical protein